MTRPIRLHPIPKTAAIALRLACAWLAVLAVAAGTSDAAVTYEHQSQSDFEHQLAGGEIQSATINKVIGSVRITLKDGRHVVFHYGKHQEPVVAAKLKAGGVTVAILSPTQAKEEAKNKPVHHKLRYIAGGILIAVIVIVGAVLVINRRRKLQADYDD